VSAAKNPGPVIAQWPPIFEERSKTVLSCWAFHKNVSRETFFSSGEQIANDGRRDRNLMLAGSKLLRPFLVRDLPVSFDWYFQFLRYDDEHNFCAASAAGVALRMGAVSAF
jgi:hypothetical protein